jgi:hypothetical protein
MGQVLHGSATTTEAVRRTIQHSHVWTALADQGISDVVRCSRVRSCLRPCRKTLLAGPDGFPLVCLPDQKNELDAPTMLQLPEPILACLHHNVVTLDSVIA